MMKKSKENGLEFLAKLPWQANVIFALTTFICLRWIFPVMMAGNPTYSLIATRSSLTPPSASCFSPPWP
jgi:hypothetical protein